MNVPALAALCGQHMYGVRHFSAIQPFSNTFSAPSSASMSKLDVSRQRMVFR